MSKKETKRAAARDAFRNAVARLGMDLPSALEGTEYVMQRMTRDYATLNALYRESWIVRRIISVVPADMLKNWVTITSQLEPELLDRYKREMRKTQLIAKLKQGLQWGRLYGGALAIMLVSGQGEHLDQPLSLESMIPGDFKGLMVFDRWNGISPSSELEDNISDPEYGLPKYYQVTDPAHGTLIKVHHSRCIRFTGNDLPYWEQMSEIYWGASVVESIFDELKKRDNVSWNIAQLTFMANIRVLKMNDLGQLLSMTDQESQAELYRTVQAQNHLLSNSGIQLMDAADSLETHQYTFSGLAEVYQQFIMDISGAAEIPVTRLFGRSPSGLNATGESDLQNYYDMIAENQETHLRPILTKLFPVVFMSAIGAVPDDLDFEFDPVAEPSDEERTDLAKSGTDVVVAAVNAGLVSPRTGLKELKQQSERTGMWTNITDEDIEKASDDIDAGGEMGGMPGMGDYGQEPPEQEGPPSFRSPTGDSWNENEHPRDKSGKFASNGGGIESSGLKHQDKSVTAGYTDTPSAGVINGLLRDGKPTDEYKDVISRLDNAMEEIKNTTTLYRGVPAHSFLLDPQLGLNPEIHKTPEDVRNAIVGKTYKDKGFMSTQHTRNGDEYGSLKMVITARPGTKALWTGNDKENEVILGRNQSFKIKDIYHEDKDNLWSPYIVELESV